MAHACRSRSARPIFSDAIVDYRNRPKLAYEYIKQGHADVCVICCEPDLTGPPCSEGGQ
ncbi:MAG: hypothetical protein JKX85_11260 [Phycisphaeraceae bacterium]|nr:hypothetical protein [Phycisphaeraceae bacterium]